jgi:hypothetical protein
MVEELSSKLSGKENHIQAISEALRAQRAENERLIEESKIPTLVSMRELRKHTR